MKRLGVMRILCRLINRVLGYHRFNWDLFADRARWTIGWAQCSACDRGATEIDVRDFECALSRVSVENRAPELIPRHLPFSLDAKRLI